MLKMPDALGHKRFVQWVQASGDADFEDMQSLLRDLKEAEGSENAPNDDALVASSPGEDMQQGGIQLADEATKTEVRSALLLLLHV